MKIRCDIAGVDCPHCAAKLEDLLAKAFGAANLNFAMGSLVLETADDCDEAEAVEKANRVAAGFEDGISITLRD